MQLKESYKNSSMDKFGYYIIIIGWAANTMLQSSICGKRVRIVANKIQFSKPEYLN